MKNKKLRNEQYIIYQNFKVNLKKNNKINFTFEMNTFNTNQIILKRNIFLMFFWNQFFHVF